MRNCTRLFHYVWHWSDAHVKSEKWNTTAPLPINRKLKSKKAAMRLLKRFPFDGGHPYVGQMDCRGVYKGRPIRYCCAYWKNGKIVEQEMPK